MRNKDCGCSPKKEGTPKDSEFLLIQATGRSANPCGLPNEDTSAEANCAKQEPTFDSIRSQFLVPVSGQSTNILVCNASVYNVGQWIEFLNPSVILQITGINDNSIALRNGCPNGVSIDSNPNPGTTVSNGALFSVASKPPCLTEAQRTESLQEITDAMTELQASSMLESSSSAIIQPVGRVQSDLSNSSAKQAIRRIFGILFNAGKPILSALGAPINLNERTLYRDLVIHKTSHEVREIKNHSEDDNLVNGKQYIPAFQSNNEYSLGPVYGVNKFSVDLATLGDLSTTPRATYASVAGTHNVPEINLAGYADIINTKRDLDHYWVDVNVFMSHNVGQEIRVYINGEFVARVGDATNIYSQNLNSIFSVRIPNSSQKLNISFVAPVAWTVAYKISLKAMYF